MDAALMHVNVNDLNLNHYPRMKILLIWFDSKWIEELNEFAFYSTGFLKTKFDIDE